MEVTKDCVSPSLLISVLIVFLVVRFDTVKVLSQAVIEELHSLVISFFCKYAERGGKKIFWLMGSASFVGCVCILVRFP